LSPDTRKGVRSPGPTLIFLVTEDWYFWTHRLPIARAARDAGFRVLVATRVQSHGDRIRAERFELRPLAWRRRGDGILGGLRALWSIWRIYRVERPTLVHHVALKAVVFGSVAAFAAAVPHRVNAIAGLGFAFAHRSLKALVVRTLILLALRLFVKRRESRVIVQNPQDGEHLVARGVVGADQITIIRGSGVDIHRFKPSPEPPGRIVVTMVTRMLRHKGIEVFISAAQLLRKRALQLRFLLIGPIDADSPAPLSESKLQEWTRNGDVEWLGARDDIPAVWAGAHIAAFPSFYREGVPLALLEAAACGRPIVCTDIPGCREVVADGVNGFLVRENDVLALADAIETLARDKPLRERMGQAGRLRVERYFTKEVVVAQTVALYNAMLGFAER
jgi:glycosyltransferase involved in cell wall biosynthesis